MHQLYSTYAELSSRLAVEGEKVRERLHTCKENCAYLSKIENSSYYHELVSHPM